MNERLETVRERLGLSKAGMGQLFGITGTAYGMIENGHRNLRPVYINMLVEQKGVRREFLEKGEEPVFKSDENEKILKLYETLTDEQKDLVIQVILNLKKPE